MGQKGYVDKKFKELIEFQDLRQDNQMVCAEMLVNKDLPSFAGHFPGNPILPAVSIIDISLHLLSSAQIPTSHNSIRVKRSKFMGMVRPEQRVKIVAESEDGQNWKVLWTAAADQSRLALVHLSI